jgi:hypothetical protein
MIGHLLNATDPETGSSLTQDQIVSNVSPSSFLPFHLLTRSLSALCTSLREYQEGYTTMYD